MKRSCACVSALLAAGGCGMVATSFARAGAPQRYPEAVWRADVSSAPIPRRPAAGRLHGMKFVVERAELLSFPQEISVGSKVSDRGTAYHLRLCQGKDFFPDREFEIQLTLKAGEKLDGKSFTVRPGVANTQSTGSGADMELLLGVGGVDMKWRPAKANLPETLMFDANVRPRLSLRLQFGRRRQDGALPGGIYLCLPDKEQSFVAGTFLIARKNHTSM